MDSDYASFTSLRVPESPDKRPPNYPVPVMAIPKNIAEEVIAEEQEYVAPYSREGRTPFAESAMSGTRSVGEYDRSMMSDRRRHEITEEYIGVPSKPQLHRHRLGSTLAGEGFAGNTKKPRSHASIHVAGKTKLRDSGREKAALNPINSNSIPNRTGHRTPREIQENINSALHHSGLLKTGSSREARDMTRRRSSIMTMEEMEARRFTPVLHNVPNMGLYPTTVSRSPSPPTRGQSSGSRGQSPVDRPPSVHFPSTVEICAPVSPPPGFEADAFDQSDTPSTGAKAVAFKDNERIGGMEAESSVQSIASHGSRGGPRKSKTRASIVEVAEEISAGLFETGSLVSVRDGTSLSDQPRRRQSLRYVNTSDLKVLQIPEPISIPDFATLRRVSVEAVKDWESLTAAAKKEQEIFESEVAKGNVKVEMDEGEEVPYTSQADANMYTMKNINKRKDLKTRTKIITLIELYWQTASKSPLGGISKNEYIAINKKVYYSLVVGNSDADEEDAEATALDDWAIDSKGMMELDYEMFFNSLFNLVDTWTMSTHVDEYGGFLASLYDNITEPVPEVPGARKWKADADILPLAYQYRPASTEPIQETVAEDEMHGASEGKPEQDKIDGVCLDDAVASSPVASKPGNETGGTPRGERARVEAGWMNKKDVAKAQLSVDVGGNEPWWIRLSKFVSTKKEESEVMSGRGSKTPRTLLKTHNLTVGDVDANSSAGQRPISVSSVSYGIQSVTPEHRQNPPSPDPRKVLVSPTQRGSVAIGTEQSKAPLATAVKEHSETPADEQAKFYTIDFDDALHRVNQEEKPDDSTGLPVRGGRQSTKMSLSFMAPPDSGVQWDTFYAPVSPADVLRKRSPSPSKERAPTSLDWFYQGTNGPESNFNTLKDGLYSEGKQNAQQIGKSKVWKKLKSRIRTVTMFKKALDSGRDEAAAAVQEATEQLKEEEERRSPSPVRVKSPQVLDEEVFFKEFGEESKATRFLTLGGRRFVEGGIQNKIWKGHEGSRTSIGGLIVPPLLLEEIQNQQGQDQGDVEQEPISESARGSPSRVESERGSRRSRYTFSAHSPPRMILTERPQPKRLIKPSSPPKMRFTIEKKKKKERERPKTRASTRYLDKEKFDGDRVMTGQRVPSLGPHVPLPDKRKLSIGSHRSDQLDIDPLVSVCIETIKSREEEADEEVRRHMAAVRERQEREREEIKAKSMNARVVSVNKVMAAKVRGLTIHPYVPSRDHKKSASAVLSSVSRPSQSPRVRNANVYRVVGKYPVQEAIVGVNVLTKPN